MNIVVFDTETTNLEKPFCYNIGYVIANMESGETLLRRDFVVEQVWHNDMLFTTAYYANKREIYVKRMQGRKCIMDKFGYITQQMYRDFKYHNVELAFAFNSPFDTKVFAYNCEWFKCINPFDDIEIKDIRAFVHCFVAFDKDFQDFCEKHELFTESGNYSTTAETLFKYVSGNTDFTEEHTALADSEIELEILKFCLEQGAKLDGQYKTYSSIKRNVEQVLKVEQRDKSGNVRVDEFVYKSRRNYKDEKGQVCRIVLKSE